MLHVCSHSLTHSMKLQPELFQMRVKKRKIWFKYLALYGFLRWCAVGHRTLLDTLFHRRLSSLSLNLEELKHAP